MRFDGKSNKQRARTFKLTELSGVTTPAHTGADVTIFKAASDDGAVYAYNPKDGEPKLRIDDAAHVGGAIAALGPKGFRGQKVEIPEADLPGVIARVRAAWRKFHPDMTDEDMPQAIRKFSDVTKSIFTDELDKIVREKNMYLRTQPVWDTIYQNEQALRESIEEAAKQDMPVQPIIAEFVMSLAQSLLTNEDPAMSAELQKQLDEATAQIGVLTAEAGMSDAQKAYYGTLDETAKASFRALDNTTRDVMVDTAKSADEVVKINGAEIRKSAVGAATFEVLKAQQATIAKQAEDAEVAKFETLAKSADFEPLPGEVTAKGIALRAIDALPEVAKAAITSMLKAGSEAMKARHTPAGHKVDLEGMSAQDKLDSLSKAYAKEHNCSVEVATAKVMETADGAELYKLIDQGK